MVELVGGGFFINGAYTVYIFVISGHTPSLSVVEYSAVQNNSV